MTVSVRLTDGRVLQIADEPVGTGAITSVDGLDEGDHTIELVYVDPSRDQRFAAATQLVARPSKYPIADEWDDWNPFDQP